MYIKNKSRLNPNKGKSKLNEDLFMHIQNNEIKRKLLKKQISKLEKILFIYYNFLVEFF